MIQPQTYLTVADNTGAKKIMCIRVLGGNRKYAKVGDIIIGVVKEATPNMLVKRSDIIRAVIVRTKKAIKRKDGTAVKFDDNAGVIINTEKNATTKYGVLSKIFHDKLTETLKVKDFTTVIKDYKNVSEMITSTE